MINKILNNPIVSLAARLIVGVVFLFFSIGKIADPAGFARSIANYGIVPDYLINIMALTLPWIELVCAVLLITGIMLRPGALITGAMLVVFIIAIIIAISRGLNIDCGCSTEAAEKVGLRKILEDTAYLLACLYIFFYPVGALRLDRLPRGAKV